MSTNRTRTGRPTDRHSLDKIAGELIETHRIVAGDLRVPMIVNGREGKEVLHTNPGWGGKVEQLALELAMMLPAETLGRIIVAEPNAALYNIHCGTWLGKYESGPYLLQQIAATAIVCRIRVRLLGERFGVQHYMPEQTGMAA